MLAAVHAERYFGEHGDAERGPGAVRGLPGPVGGSGGARVHVGPALSARTRPLVPADRERWLRIPAPHPEWDWPEETPPFDLNRVLRAADGETWVGTHLVEDGFREWHRIDDMGALVATIELPEDEQLRWVDARGILVTRPDDLGLNWLMRRLLPPAHDPPVERPWLEQPTPRR